MSVQNQTSSDFRQFNAGKIVLILGSGRLIFLPPLPFLLGPGSIYCTFVYVFRAMQFKSRVCKLHILAGEGGFSVLPRGSTLVNASLPQLVAPSKSRPSSSRLGTKPYYSITRLPEIRQTRQTCLTNFKNV